MSVLDRVLSELDESYIIENITKKHDEARIQYHLRSNTVSDDTEFDDVIADYYNHQFSMCAKRIPTAGSLPTERAAGVRSFMEPAGRPYTWRGCWRRRWRSDSRFLILDSRFALI